MKGIIALDIDGTLTGSDHLVAPEVIEYLELLHSQQWRFIFITGRPYSWGIRGLKDLTFPYFLAIYNGAYMLSMPEGQVAERHLIGRETLIEAVSIAQRFETGLVVYGGLEEGEEIYFTPQLFDRPALEFFEKRSQVSLEKWIAVETPEQIPHQSITSIKFFVPQQKAERIAEVLEGDLGLHAPIIKDPVDPDYIVLQATDAQATKGDALENFSSICRWTGIRIAAGNDINDATMFQKAHITIAMQDSPLALRELATIIAPPVEDFGLIEGLKHAVSRYEASLK